ncbi:MAG: hypothetical protein ABI790_16905 [Betaproteobacteria bacterium]
MNKTIYAVLLLLCVSGNARADDAGIRRCRGIADATTRLACYDALVVPAADAKVPASRLPTQAESRNAPVIAATPPVPVNMPQSKIEQFGLENRTSPAVADAIDSYIPGRFEGWEAKSSIKLANGQVWQIADDSNRYVTLSDPKVRIRRGALGSFYLEFDKINHSPRVKRVQ